MTASASPDLPAILAEIASVVGVDHALKLASLRGGQTVTIPAVLRESNWLVSAIGLEPARALSEHFTSGNARAVIELPRGPAGAYFSARAERAEIVRTGHKQGLTGNQIAALAGISRRSVHRQIAKIRRAAERDSHRKDVSA